MNKKQKTSSQIFIYSFYYSGSVEALSVSFVCLTRFFLLFWFCLSNCTFFCQCFFLIDWRRDDDDDIGFFFVRFVCFLSIWLFYFFPKWWPSMALKFSVVVFVDFLLFCEIYVDADVCVCVWRFIRPNNFQCFFHCNRSFIKGKNFMNKHLI